MVKIRLNDTVSVEMNMLILDVIAAIYRDSLVQSGTLFNSIISRIPSKNFELNYIDI